jgi:hypothetical protein
MCNVVVSIFSPAGARIVDDTILSFTNPLTEESRMFTEFIRKGTGNRTLGVQYIYVQMFGSRSREGMGHQILFLSAKFSDSIAKSKGTCLDISV